MSCHYSEGRIYVAHWTGNWKRKALKVWDQKGEFLYAVSVFYIWLWFRVANFQKETLLGHRTQKK